MGRSFTTRFNGLSNVLINKVDVTDPTRNRLKGIMPINIKFQYNAIWDTGATNSCISNSLAMKLGLVPVGKSPVYTPAGKSQFNRYVIDLYLQNQVIVQSVQVTEAPNGIANADLLIGMDVIGLGDFAVTNDKGKTVFSFRIPSEEVIDFVKRTPAVSNKVGRNQPCPCGSGKKYKYCCGAK